MQLTGTNQSESYSLALISRKRHDLQLYRYAVSKEQIAPLNVSGADGGGATPVPIPNTAVKPANADGTETAGSLGE